jgi:hypothetical protein
MSSDILSRQAIDRIAAIIREEQPTADFAVLVIDFGPGVNPVSVTIPTAPLGAAAVVGIHSPGGPGAAAAKGAARPKA